MQLLRLLVGSERTGSRSLAAAQVSLAETAVATEMAPLSERGVTAAAWPLLDELFPFRTRHISLSRLLCQEQRA